MKRLATLCAVGLLAALCSACAVSTAAAKDEADKATAEAQAQAANMSEDYKLGPADLIEISVWGDETLSRTVRIRPDGKLSYPLVGEAQASGRTIEDLRQEIEKKIDEFVPKANVTVILTESASKRFYVIGKVKSPSVYPMYDAVNVLQGLTMAGGLDSFADDSDIRIIRQGESGTQIIKFDYSQVVKGRDTAQNILLQSKDIIVVP